MVASVFSQHGSWNAATRAIPALRFLEVYTKKVDAIDITGPFHNWYAPSARFYNSNGTVYNGGQEIWSWIGGLFGPFVSVYHDNKIIRLFPASEMEAASDRDANWIMIDTETAFNMSGKLAGSDPIVVPRFLMFLVGKSEVEGQGTDGLQILEAKVWWDTAVVQQEFIRRQLKLSSEE